MAPKPPSLVAPRRSRGAPRSSSPVGGPRNGPQTPIARRAPAQPGRASINPTLVPARQSRAAPRPLLGVASSRRTARSIARRGRPAAWSCRTGSRSRTPWASRSVDRLRLRTADSRADVTGCRTHSRCSCLHGASRIVPASAAAGAVAGGRAQNGEGWRWWSAAFSNRAYCGRNTTLMVPVGPLRCLPMMTSAMFSSSGGTSSR